MTARGKKRGRPPIYSDKLATTICKRLAEGESLRKICADEAMPDKSTVLAWLFDGKHEEFSDQYRRAREAQAEGYADDIISIADDGRNDTYVNEDGAEVVNHDIINRSRLRIESRKWISAKLLPKRYGDKLQHTGDGGGPVAFVMNLHRDA